MVSILIDGDNVEVTGSKEELAAIAKLHYIDAFEDKIVLNDPIPHRGSQIVNAVFWDRRT
jgi:hypothetical protein